MSWGLRKSPLMLSDKRASNVIVRMINIFLSMLKAILQLIIIRKRKRNELPSSLSVGSVLIESISR